jgi:type VI secretion system protein VasD
MIPRHLLVLLAVLAVSVMGCGGTQSPACQIPEEGNLMIEATDRLNPDDAGRALPTIVRLYQLTNLGNLELASFEQIWRQPEDTLGDTMVASDEVTVYPGQRVHRAFERNPDANFLVGVAIVRRPAGVSWRTVLELPASAEAQRCASLQADPEEAPPLPDVSRVEFRVDMYTIEGSLALQPVGGDCATTDLECQRNRVQLPESPEVEQPEQPQAPEMPDVTSSVPTGKFGS